MNPWHKNRHQPPSEIMMALCEAYNPEPERKLNGQASMDGYRIHINPDGSAVWLEGVGWKKLPFILEGAGDAIERCIKRRGLEWPRDAAKASWTIRQLPNGHPLKNILKLAKICYLERKFCGEEDW